MNAAAAHDPDGPAGAAGGLDGVELVDRDGIRTVRVVGDLDLARAGALESWVGPPADDSRGLELDLREVDFADSTAVRWCVRLERTAADRGQPLRVRATGAAAAALRLAGLGRLLVGGDDGDDGAPPEPLAGGAPPRDGPGRREAAEHELHFLARATAPAVARAATSRWTERSDRVARHDDLLLVVSELVTNVVIHTGGPGRLGLRLDPAVVVEVHDTSPRLPEPVAEAGSHGGFGLRLVERLARRWGCAASGDGKVLWVELEASSAPTGGTQGAGTSPL